MYNYPQEQRKVKHNSNTLVAFELFQTKDFQRANGEPTKARMVLVSQPKPIAHDIYLHLCQVDLDKIHL